MAEKKMVVVVCDFPHKHDRQAVGQLTLDVCSTHMKVFETVGKGAICPECGKAFKLESGLRHHQTVVHGAEPATAPAKRKKVKAKRTTRTRGKRVRAA